MELKTVVAIGLVVFIVGALIFLKIRAKKKCFLGQPYRCPFYIPKKQKEAELWFISSIQT